MKRDYATFLDDVKESIEKIEEYTRGRSIEEFKGNSAIQDAVLRRPKTHG